MKSIPLKLLILILVLAVAATGCSNTDSEPAAEPENEQGEGFDGLTKENPLQVNKEEGTITFLAQVNGKYFYEPTRHGAVFAEGGNGEKAVFRAFAQHEDFYNGLIELGAEPGNNMTMDNAAETHVEGDALDVTVNWDGAEKAVSLDEAIIDSNGNPIDIRFGGNLEAAKDKNTGCLICLDSCPVGITSNASYTMGAVEKRKEVEFKGNEEILPDDGTYVAITMKLKK